METLNVRLRRFGVLVLLASMLSLAGCETAGQGALSGGAVGALGGLAIGSMSGDAGKGAAIGAIGGAVVGGVIGDQNRRAQERQNEIHQHERNY